MFDNLRNFFKNDRPLPQRAQTEPLRWVVLDTETTGLNVWRDDVISIAAVGIHLEPLLMRPRIVLADSFEVVIKPTQVKLKKQNVLIHHIGVGEQQQGEQRVQALEDFRAWVGDSPLLAYMAPFDCAMLKRAYKKAGLAPLSNEWLDVEPLTRLVAQDTYKYALDERLQTFGLQCVARHTAAADTFVTAELLLKLLDSIRLQANSWHQIKQALRDIPK